MKQQATILIARNPAIVSDPLQQALSRHANLVYADSSALLPAVLEEMRSIDLLIFCAEHIDDALLAVCRQLKFSTAYAAIPQLIYSANVDAESWQRALQAGVDRLLMSSLPAVALAAEVNTQLALKQKTDLLTELVLLDGLTSVANRQRFEDNLDIEWRRALREYTTLSLITVDIDGFADYNQLYGKNAGDLCLRRLARLLENNCLRAADMVGRTVDDEFTALLPGTDLDKALQVADKILKAFQLLAIEQSNNPGGILTLSIGVACIEPTRDAEPADLQDESAEMLAQARHGGGNQVQGIML